MQITEINLVLLVFFKWNNYIYSTKKYLNFQTRHMNVFRNYIEIRLALVLLDKEKGDFKAFYKCLLTFNYKGFIIREGICVW